MPPPTNTTIATALPVGPLPISVTQDLTGLPVVIEPEFSLGVIDLWYAFAATSDLVTGLLGYTAAVEQALLSIWTGTVATPTLYLQSGLNARLQFAPQVGATYYLRLRVETEAPLTASVTLTGYTGPPWATAIEAGQILVNNDEPGFPGMVVSPVTGEVVAFLDIVAGETGDVLPNGRLLLSVADDGLVLYDAGFQQLATLGLEANVGSGNQLDRFYVLTRIAADGTYRIRLVDVAGTLGATWGPLPVASVTWLPQLVAVNRAETVAYIANASPTSSTIARWDLVANVALPDLAPHVTGHVMQAAGVSPGGLLVLADQTIVAAYWRTNLADSHLRRYAPDGTLLNTWVWDDIIGTTDELIDRLAHDPVDDGATFWVWTKPTGRGKFYHFAVATGTVLSVGEGAEVRDGGRFVLDADTTSRLFGHAFSCPFVVLRQDAEVVDGGGGSEQPPYVAPSHHLEARYIRRLRRAPHVNNEHLRVFYRRFELDLERGQGLATGQGEDPLVMLRLSRDGGQTWSEPMLMHAGRLGAYGQRVLARRLGQARDTVFEVTVSDPIAWSLVGAWLELEPGAH